MSLKFLSLNIEGDRHLQLRVLPFLKRFKPQICCLQEVFKVDLPILEKELGLTSFFVPMTLVTQTSIHMANPKGVLGLAFLTNLPVKEFNFDYYVGKTEAPLPVFFENQNPNNIKRALAKIKIKKNNLNYQLAQTHFTWSVKGRYTLEQQQDFVNLKKLLQQIPELVFCGDLNSPRGEGGIFDLLSKQYQDNIPTQVISTLDPKLHKAGKLDLVVDALFTSKKYQASQVKLISGVSDHQAVTALISQN